MTIKSSKAYWVIAGIIFSFGPILFMICVSKFGWDDLFLGLFIGSVASLLGVSICLTYCRTLTMDKDGCTVKILKYKRVYKWSELETRCIVDCSHSWREKISYTTCFVFCKKKHKNPKWLHPAIYSLYFHPLSFMFVCFDPHLKFKPYHEEIYLVEEDEFLAKMLEWNVDIVDERKEKTER